MIGMSDYMSSEIGLVSLGGASSDGKGIDLGRDPTLTSSAGQYFWIARELGQIFQVDASCLHSKATFDANDPGVPGTTEPYDVAVAPDHSLWIARFATSSVLVLNADGSRRMTVDLGSEDGVDGNPNMNSIKILDPAVSSGNAPAAVASMTTSKAYVSLEILDDNNDLTSTRPSKLARIDLETGVVESTLVLQGRNPIGLIVLEGSQLYLADAGNWQNDTTAQAVVGIERVDTVSFTSKLLFTGETLGIGQHVLDVAVTTGCAVAIVSGPLPFTPTTLIRFDPTTGIVREPSVIPAPSCDSASSCLSLSGLAWLGDNVLLVGDRNLTGLHAFDVSAGCGLTEQKNPIPLPMPPVNIVALH
jgi:hypothetical protein